jgi:hypothetical protein
VLQESNEHKMAQLTEVISDRSSSIRSIAWANLRLAQRQRDLARRRRRGAHAKQVTADKEETWVGGAKSTRPHMDMREKRTERSHHTAKPEKEGLRKPVLLARIARGGRT